MKKRYLNPQWQGGGDLSTYDGAEALEKYLTGKDFVRLPVSADETELSVRKNGIRGFDVLRRQMRAAYDRVRTDAPDKIFALGGGCDADVPFIVYLCEKYGEDLTLLWLDAHGDLNAPEESASSLFYGMPLRSVMDAHCFGLLENRMPLRVPQIIHVGGRDFDDAERAFIKTSGMTAYSVRDFRSDAEFAGRLCRTVRSHHIYVHLDLDVLDPGVFPNTPLPVDGGLYWNEVWDILRSAADRLVGLGIYEYLPAKESGGITEKLIQFGTAL